MAQFINTDKGFINIADVRRVVELTTAPEAGRKYGDHYLKLYCRDEDGGYTATVRPHDYINTREILSTTLIPAAAHSFVTVLYEPVDGDDASQVEVARYPIAAWRIDDLLNVATPILPDDLSSNATMLIELADGELLAPYEQIFPNLTAAKEEIWQRAQRDRRRAEPPNETNPVS